MTASAEAESFPTVRSSCQLCVCAHVWTNVSTHVCTHVCTHVYTHVHTHVYTHVCAHVCTHIYTHGTRCLSCWRYTAAGTSTGRWPNSETHLLAMHCTLPCPAIPSHLLPSHVIPFHAMPYDAMHCAPPRPALPCQAPSSKPTR